jgi:carboxyl-terminal processing protease
MKQATALGARNTFKNIGLIVSGVLAGVLLSLGISAVAQRVADARNPLPIEELRQFTDVFGAIKANYVEPVDDKKLIADSINGMVSGLDPHSAYLDEKAYRELHEQTVGHFGGLGIEVGSEDGYIKVITPLEDTPAYRAGVKTGDYIVKVDDVSIKGMSITEAVTKLRGAPKTKVTITLLRKGEASPIVVTLIREEIKVQSVRAKMLDSGIGYVRVTQFQDPTVEDLSKKMAELYKAGPLKGLVLDLRNNPGGVLPGAIGVSAAFLPANSLIVSTKGQVAEAQAQYYGTKDEYQRGGDDVLRNLPPEAHNVPMVVLVNGGSASASEIVAGALQDYKRASILGTQTFGKGSVQTILPLPPDRKTGVKLTISRYYTPSGRSIQNTGITPDYIVDDTAQGNIFEFPRESDLEHHLSNPQNAPADASDTKPEDAAKPADAKPAFKPIEFGSKDDYQLSQALHLLKGEPVETKKMTADASHAAKPLAANSGK